MAAIVGGPTPTTGARHATEPAQPWRSRTGPVPGARQGPRGHGARGHDRCQARDRARAAMALADTTGARHGTWLEGLRHRFGELGRVDRLAAAQELREVRRRDRPREVVALADHAPDLLERRDLCGAFDALRDRHQLQPLAE